MSNYTVFASSDVMQANKSSITATSTKFNGGTVKNGGNVATNGPLDASNVVEKLKTEYGSSYVAGVNNAVGAALWQLSNGNMAIANGSGVWAGHDKVTDTSHGRVVGDVIKLIDNNAGNAKSGFYRIVAVVDANSYIINSAYTSAIGSQINVYHAERNLDNTALVPVGNLRAGYYAMRGVPLQVYNAGTIIETMGSPSSDFGRRKVNSRASVRSHLVATAIRAGYWDVFSGTFSTDPTAQNDYSSFGLDSEVQDAASGYGTAGEFAWRYGITTTQDDY